MNTLKITDRVNYVGRDIPCWLENNFRLIITGENNDCFAVSDGYETRWVKGTDVVPYVIHQTATFQEFSTIIKNEEQKYQKLYNLCIINNGELSIAYGSLAANSLTILHILKSIFEIYKEEFAEPIRNESRKIL